MEEITREEKVLNDIKKIMFCDSTSKELGQKSLDEITDEEFARDYFIYICKSFDVFYCMNKDDIVEVLNLIRSVKRNPEEKKFPDFICKKGYIEHFEITSSKETSDGSKERIYNAEYERNVVENGKAELKKLYEEHGIRKIRISNKKIQYHSYEYFISSFLKNFIKHIERAIACNKNGVKAFLIEYSDFMLEMCEDKFNNCAELHYGNFHAEKPLNDFYLSRDKKLLNILREYCGEIDYVIFKNRSSVEIMKLKNIPELLKLLPYDFFVLSKQIIGQNSTLELI